MPGPPRTRRKGADSGIDGYINFFDDNSGTAKRIVAQVKSGHVTASQIRDLKAVVDREKAVIGVFITLESPTKPMKQEALAAGYYSPEHLAKEHTAPKIQIVTIAELLSRGSNPVSTHACDNLQESRTKIQRTRSRTRQFIRGGRIRAGPMEENKKPEYDDPGAIRSVHRDCRADSSGRCGGEV